MADCYKVTVGEASPLSLGELSVDDPLTLNRIIASSIEVPNGTPVPNSNIFLSSGWDADATSSVDAGSTNQRGVVRVTVGTSPVGSPFWSLNYSVPWSADPFPMVIREGSVQPMASSTLNTLTVTQTGAISSGSIIVYHYLVM